MRILVVSYAFPPYNVMGAVRLGHTAAWLARFGHDVKVVTARDQPFKPTLHVELDGVEVTYTRWVDVFKAARLTAARLPISPERSGGEVKSSLQAARRHFRRTLSTFVNFPDPEIGWYPFAVAAGRRIIRDWSPTVIYSSGKPFTSLLVAHALARRSGIPWVAELRDLWSDNHYRTYSRLRNRMDRGLEARTLRAADGIVSVTEPFVDILSRRYRKPTVTVLNGFDSTEEGASTPPTRPTTHLDIVYTGIIYPGRRDPSNLFRALGVLESDAERVRVSFYGPDLHRMLAPSLAVAAEVGVAHRVQIMDAVSHAEAVALQRQADVLLLLTWDHPEESMVYPGKLFEYVGAQRPILALGCDDGIAAELIRSRSLGFASNTPTDIAVQLREWLSAKSRGGVLPGPSAASLTDLSRPTQVRRLEAFLETVARSGYREP